MKPTNNYYINREEYQQLAKKLITEMTAISEIITDENSGRLDIASRLLTILNTLDDDKEKLVFISGIIAFHETETLDNIRMLAKLNLYNIALTNMLLKHGYDIKYIKNILSDRFPEDEIC